jgi:hypothetical protein
MLDAWLQLDSASSLVYEKELLPVGKLTKWVDGAKKVLDADITRSFLDNIVTNFKKFKEVGIRVPVFKTHKEDPDNKRGQVEDVYVKQNSRGEDSLFSKIKFDSQDAVQLGTTNDVSVLVPPKFVDGRSNKYLWPLRHVAITSTPVLPGLDGWEGPVVLAYETEVIGGDDVDLKPLFTELSLDFAGTKPEEQLELALEAVKTMKTELSTCQTQLKLALEDDEEELVLSFPPVMMKQFRNSRESVIEGLMAGPAPAFSPALGKQIKELYCSETALRLDLQQDKEETEFDRMIELSKAIVKDRPLANSGRKTIKASQEGDSGNPLLEGAKARAKRAEAKANAPAR